MTPLPPPGWYPEASSGGQRWWSGRDWTPYTRLAPVAPRVDHRAAWRWVFLCTIGLPILPAYLWARLIYGPHR